jgi:hypothetical protein
MAQRRQDEAAGADPKLNGGTFLHSNVIMPKCPYCGRTPFLTFCASYTQHLEVCRGRHEEAQTRLRLEAKLRQQKLEKELLRSQLDEARRSQAAPTLIIAQAVNIFNPGYPQNETTQQVVASARSFDLKKLTTVEDLNLLMGRIQDMNGGELQGILSGDNKRAQAQTLAFLAHVMREIRERLQREAPPLRTPLIEAAENFEKECLDDKQRLDVD